MRTKKEESESKVNLTPMLDVVFIMLIFFIVTASFVTEVGIDATPPEPKLVPPPDAQVRNILVRIEANDQLIVEDKYSDPRVVLANLTRLHAQQPEASVVIDAHPDSSTESLVLVMDSARLVGANVTLAK